MLRPLNDNVVLIKEVVTNTTKSGIILSESQETEYAVVKAIGEGFRNMNGDITPIDLKVGDKVIYNSYNIKTVNHDGQEYLIISARDILAVIE